MKRSYGTADAGQTSVLSISPRLESRQKKFLETFSNGSPKRRKSAGADRKVRQRRVGMDITWITDRIGVGVGFWNGENMAAESRAGLPPIIVFQIHFAPPPLP